MKINDTFRYLHVGLPEDILRHKLCGNLEHAVRLIDRRLSMDNIPKALRACLTVQREMILRMPDDYPYTKADALAILREHIPDFSEEEFDERVDAGKIGWIYLNGEMHFFNRFFQTMCKAEPAFAVRAGVQMPGVESAGKGSQEEGRLDRCIRLMKENGSLSNRIRIRASMRIKDEHFTPGMFVRAHLPIPIPYRNQTDIRIEKVYPPTGKIDSPYVPQRTVCWEENMQENHEFYVEYSYVHTAYYTDTENPQETLMPENGEYTAEEPPHILFTPYIRELVDSLTNGVTDPLEKARRFYDFITLND